jgi:sulfur relay (sulfurtransferase) DsrC/TusE family protein
MKLLSKKISQISKSALQYSLLIGGLILSPVQAKVVSSDRFLIKILDRTVSLQDIQFQFRNIQALNCIYDDAYIVQYFNKGIIHELDQFLKDFPENDEDVKKYLHRQESILKKTRQIFKMLRYSEDQKSDVSKDLANLIRESAKENKCNSEVLYKDTLKSNFISLMELELYLRARYSGQLKNNQRFDTVRPSIELFVESLDKQFGHEYYW